MGVLADWQIFAENIITSGFELYDYEKQKGKMSWGLSSYGYDARLGPRFRIFKPYPVTLIDPKNLDQRAFEEVISDTHIDIPGHSYILGESFEEFCIPRDVLCIVTGKSSLARAGLIVNVTPGEPEWRGRWTIEISNSSPVPVRVYVGEGIMQCIFFRTDAQAAVSGLMFTDIQRLYQKLQPAFPALASEEEAGINLSCAVVRNQLRTCLVSYADKKGKYQDQAGLTHTTVTK